MRVNRQKRAEKLGRLYEKAMKRVKEQTLNQQFMERTFHKGKNK